VRRRLLVLVGVAALVALSAAAVVVLTSGSASARAESTVQPLADAPVPAVFKDGIRASARAAGASASDLLEVAAVGDRSGRSGLVLGHGSSGELVSLFTPYNFTSFASPQRLLRGRSIAVFASIQPDAVGETGHVQLTGVASPRVARAALELADGSSLDVELVRAGRGGHAFFTYVTDRKPLFPRLIRAYDAVGVEIQEDDLRADIVPPT
jgi:hypothetical protein